MAQEAAKEVSRNRSFRIAERRKSITEFNQILNQVRLTRKNSNQMQWIIIKQIIREINKKIDTLVLCNVLVICFRIFVCDVLFCKNYNKNCFTRNLIYFNSSLVEIEESAPFF